MQNIEYTEEELRIMIARCVGEHRTPKRFKIITDTTDFFRVDYDDIVILDKKPYLIRNYEREGRFGIDDEPKFWVKRAINLTDCSTKIIKLVFHERFKARVGDIVFDCVRSPGKEARILDLVRGHSNFMQGFSVTDSSGNIIRIIDYISGITFADYITSFGNSHEEYFFKHFHKTLDEYIDILKAINFLHKHGEKHGDIRRDHIIRDSATGKLRWIDFDFNYFHRENMFGYDLFGLGNLLIYLTGRGDVTIQELRQKNVFVAERLNTDDMNIIFHNRVANLKKVYPYIPDSLNTILLHFSNGANVFYDNTEQLLEDIFEVKEILKQDNS